MREFLAARPALQAAVAGIPDGSMASFTDPAGNTIHVLDQKGAA